MTKKTNVILSVFNDDYEICVAPRCRVKMDRRGMLYIIMSNKKLPIYSSKFPRSIDVDTNSKYSVDIKEGLEELNELLNKKPADR